VSVPQNLFCLNLGGAGAFGVEAAGSLVIVLWGYYSAQILFSVRSSPHLLQQVGFTS